jgi:Ca2+/Na+ antiporter
MSSPRLCRLALTGSQAFAPLMGFAACFGGPMLNMLLGVGVSGALIIYQVSRRLSTSSSC